MGKWSRLKESDWNGDGKELEWGCWRLFQGEGIICRQPDERG